MATKNPSPSLVVIDKGPHNETTYMVDKCIVKIKFLSTEESDTTHEHLEKIRSALFSILNISL